MDDQLVGWKEIAGFVRTSVRTAQRWERVLGLPVHRLNAPRRAIVFGRRTELNAWLDSNEGQTAQLEAARGAGPAANAVAADPEARGSGGGRRWHDFRPRIGVVAAAGACLLLAVSLLGVWLWMGGWAVPKRSDGVSATGPDKSSSGPQVTATSRESVLLGFSVPGGSGGEVVIPVGTMASVTIADLGTLGLSPVPSGGGVDLHVFRLDGDSPAGVSRPRELATVRLQRGTTARLNQGRSAVEFVWVRTLPPPRQASSPPGRNVTQ